MNTLTAAGTYADDKLFATLDTKTRALEAGARRRRCCSRDTVGFVRDLPHHLVACFKATLEEAVHADLLLHVLDVGHPARRAAVRDASTRCSRRSAPRTSPRSSCSTRSTPTKARAAYPVWRALHPDAIPISAKTGEGHRPACTRPSTATSAASRWRSSWKISATNGKLLAFLESQCRIEKRDFEDDKVRLKAVVGRNFLRDLAANEEITILSSHALPWKRPNLPCGLGARQDLRELRPWVQRAAAQACNPLLSPRPFL